MRNKGRFKVSKGNIGLSDVTGHLTEGVTVAVEVVLDIGADRVRKADISCEYEANCLYKKRATSDK